MLAYRITRFEKDDPEYIVWAGTMREAHDQLKEFSAILMLALSCSTSLSTR